MKKSRPMPFQVLDRARKSRILEGYASTWDPDLGGDIIRPGAFADTVREWKHSPDRIIPLVDGHSYGSFRNVVGRMEEAEEDDRGLFARFSIIQGADGDALLDRLEAGALSGLSIGYKTEPGDTERTEVGGRSVRLIRRLQLFEVSAVMYPMNPRATVTAVGGESPHKAAERLIRETADGWEPDHPERLRMEERYRDTVLRSLESSLTPTWS